MRSSSTARSLIALARRVGRSLHLRQPESVLIRSAHQHWCRYWRTPTDRANDGHWRGHGQFTDDRRWLAIGRHTLQLFTEMSLSATCERVERIERIVEWGVGGGANAVHFASLCEEFVGVDVVDEALVESAAQMHAEGHTNFRPVRVDIASPEDAVLPIEPCDMFLCLYVYELLPSPEYGRRILHVAHQALRPGGVAFIQIRYQTDAAASRPLRHAYRLNRINMTTYRIEDFWQIAQESGFEPRSVRLEPHDEIVHDHRYAYFLLRKPTAIPRC